MSFFDTEKAHGGMLARVADEVPRAIPVSEAKTLEMDVSLEARSGTGSAEKSRLQATA